MRAPSIKARGMTLLEVMVALAVFAIAGLAVMKTASEHLSGLNYLEEKTLATWVVENQLVQQKLEAKWPGDSWVEGNEELAGETWYSKGANCPFIGHCLPGAVRYTLVDGHLSYKA